MKDRMRRLERAARAETFDIACPVCGERFRGPGDLAMDSVVAEWRDARGEDRDTGPVVDAVLAHPHEGLRSEALRDLPAFRPA